MIEELDLGSQDNKYLACGTGRTELLPRKQGRIHGYPSRVWVGRGSDEIDQLNSWAGAVTPKPPVNAEKS